MEEPNIKVIGRMDNTQDHSLEHHNRVYDVGGCCPTIMSNCDGDKTPKIVIESPPLG